MARLERQASPAQDVSLLRPLARRLKLHFHLVFEQLVEELDRCWERLEPEPGLPGVEGDDSSAADDLVRHLRALLERANFRNLGWERVHEALRSAPSVAIGLKVDLQDYEQLLLFVRGECKIEETFPRWLGLRHRTVSVAAHERVCLFARLVDAKTLAAHGRKHVPFTPGSVSLKLFRHIPVGDIETLLPNAEVCMRPIDRLLLGLPAAYGVVHLMVYKGGWAALLAVGVILGLRGQGGAENTAAVGALLTLGVLGAFLARQWDRFRSKKISFLQRLSHKLYYRKLDNGAGVLQHLAHVAEQSETREALLAWALLRRADVPLSLEQLDRRVEAWLLAETGREIDFDEGDALAKLLELGMVIRDGDGRLTAVDGRTALERLRARWEGLGLSAEQGALNGSASSV